MPDVDPMPAPTRRRRRLRPVLGAPAYVRRGRSACFVCEIVAGNPEYPHHLVHEDEGALAFLARGSTTWGHVLVAPKAHREHVTADFAADEYIGLQRLVHRVGDAVRACVPCARLYVLSLGSQELNRHVHWHLVPLPAGVPLWRQQLRWMSPIVNGELAVTDADLARLATHLRTHLA